MYLHAATPRSTYPFSVSALLQSNQEVLSLFTTMVLHIYNSMHSMRLPLKLTCIEQMQSSLSGQAKHETQQPQNSWHCYVTEEVQLIVQWQRAHLEASTGETANKDDLLGCLADVNETATAWSTRWEV